MKHGRSTLAVVACTAVAVSLASAGTSHAQDKKIDTVSCKELMRASDSEREASIAYLHGFLNGKAGLTDLDVDRMSKETDAFIERCLDNPKEAALAALQAVKK